MKVVKLEDVFDILNQIQDAQENGENFISAAGEMINKLAFVSPGFDVAVKIDKAWEDGYNTGYLQGRHDWSEFDD